MAETEAPRWHGDAETPTSRFAAPLWSTHVDLKMGLTKLIGVVTERCAVEAGRAGLSTRACDLYFSGARYEVTVLSGTAALAMSPTDRTVDLLMLIRHGLTEERLTTLLRRWSKRSASAGSAARSRDDVGE